MAVTPTGKDKIVKNTRLYLGGYDVSGDSRTLGTIDNSFGEVDLTGWSEAVMNYLSGRRSTSLRGYQALMNDTASSGAFTILKSPSNTELGLIFAVGGASGVAIGDPAYHLPAVQVSNPIGWDGEAAAISADFLPITSSVDANTGNPWGVVLYPATTTISATVSASSSISFDFGASSAAGWMATLMITSTASGNYSLKVRHSTDDSSFSDLGTFSADGSTIISEFLTGSGTVNRYVSFEATRTAGTITAVVAFSRN